MLILSFQNFNVKRMLTNCFKIRNFRDRKFWPIGTFTKSKDIFKLGKVIPLLPIENCSVLINQYKVFRMNSAVPSTPVVPLNLSDIFRGYGRGIRL